MTTLKRRERLRARRNWVKVIGIIRILKVKTIEPGKEKRRKR